MNVRRATGADAAAIARVKAAGWRRTYSDWVAPPVLEPFLDEGQQAHAVAGAIANGANVVLVAESHGDVVGFAICLVDGTSDPLLDSLHVLSEVRGRGIGTLLLGALALELERQGHRTVTLNVVRQNRRARDLYERLGGRYEGDRAASWAPDDVVEARYRWDDLTPLKHAADPASRASAPRRR